MCTAHPPATLYSIDRMSSRSSIIDQLTEASTSCVASRRPLVHAARAHAGTLAGVIPSAQVRQFNPRFEEGFSTGRDYDPDRQRAEQRRLKRALVKERRGESTVVGTVGW